MINMYGDYYPDARGMLIRDREFGAKYTNVFFGHRGMDESLHRANRIM